MKNAGISYCERIRAVGVLTSALIFGGLVFTVCRAYEVGPREALDEIVVTGERTGPGMWHVTHANANLWILGSISPLPHGITWRSRQVETVLQVTNQVLVQQPFDIGVAKNFMVVADQARFADGTRW